MRKNIKYSDIKVGQEFYINDIKWVKLDKDEGYYSLAMMRDLPEEFTNISYAESSSNGYYYGLSSLRKKLYSFFCDHFSDKEEYFEKMFISIRSGDDFNKNILISDFLFPLSLDEVKDYNYLIKFNDTDKTKLMWTRSPCYLYDFVATYGISGSGSKEVTDKANIYPAACIKSMAKVTIEVEEESLLTPEEFLDIAKIIVADNDIKQKHINMDSLVAKTLSKLGYKDGIDILMKPDDYYG